MGLWSVSLAVVMWVVVCLWLVVFDIFRSVDLALVVLGRLLMDDISLGVVYGQIWYGLMVEM